MCFLLKSVTIRRGRQLCRHFVIRDHLNSTSVVLNGGATALWVDYFPPFGGWQHTWKRSSNVLLQTTYRYTGQRHEPDIKLYDYGARRYDNRRGRFIQPDTIVPNPGDPQSLNRYAYVRNNPLRYTDPSGHAYCIDSDCAVMWHPINHNYVIGPGTSTAEEVARSIVQDLGGVDDLEGMAIISDVTAGLYRSWDRFLPTMGQIFIGTEKTGAFALISAVMAGGCGGIGREPRDCPGNEAYFLDRGFSQRLSR